MSQNNRIGTMVNLTICMGFEQDWPNYVGSNGTSYFQLCLAKSWICHLLVELSGVRESYLITYYFQYESSQSNPIPLRNKGAHMP